MGSCSTTTGLEAAIRELVEGKAAATELLLHLSFFISDHNPPENHGVSAAVAMTTLVDKVLGTFSAALSALGGDGEPPPSLNDGMIRGKIIPSRKRNAPASRPGGGARRHRTRAGSSSCRELRSTTADDGFAWRKYGQKEIFGAMHPRSYYRCSHKYDQGCQATKQVQRLDEDPSTFSIIYMEEHTCSRAARSPATDLSSLVSFLPGDAAAADQQEPAVLFPFQEDQVLLSDNEALSSVNILPVAAGDEQGPAADGGEAAAAPEQLPESLLDAVLANYFYDLDDELFLSGHVEFSF